MRQAQKYCIIEEEKYTLISLTNQDAVFQLKGHLSNKKHKKLYEDDKTNSYSLLYVHTSAIGYAGTSVLSGRQQ